MSYDLLKTLPQYVLPKKGLTTFAGYLAEVKIPAIKDYLIKDFIKNYQVNMSEALIEDPKEYSCFNDFFIRRLKAECRPLADADITSPVDGSISELGSIDAGQLIQAKGKYYSVEELLGADKGLAKQFMKGHFATLYLSPKDYHRVHMPLSARLLSMNYIPGALFSVQPTTARTVPKLFARNERLAIHFDTAIGPMALVMVGATIVGSITTSWEGQIKRSKRPTSFTYSDKATTQELAQGDEVGFFKLGSTVVLLFAQSKGMQWDASLRAGNSIKFGQPLGHFIA